MECVITTRPHTQRQSVSQSVKSVHGAPQIDSGDDIYTQEEEIVDVVWCGKWIKGRIRLSSVYCNINKSSSEFRVK